MHKQNCVQYYVGDILDNHEFVIQFSLILHELLAIGEYGVPTQESTGNGISWIDMAD